MKRTASQFAHVVVSACMLAGAAAAQGVETQNYIVMLNGQAASGPADVATEVSQRFGGDVGFVYRAVGGFSISLPAGAAAVLSSDPRISIVAPEGVRQIVQQTIPTGLDRTLASTNASLNIDGVDDLRVDVDVAVLDSGIDRQHTDLDVFDGVNCLVNIGNRRRPNYVCSQSGEDGDDDEGHGTHVAGTIGALDNGQDVVGMAPGARLWAVKVCNNQGQCPDSVVIAGIDWVIQNAGAEVEVMNMSLTGPVVDPANDPYEQAVNAAVDAGIVVVVAAGNNGADAAGYTPARVPRAITVSAIADYDGLPGGAGGNLCSLGGPFGYSGPDDELASFSNYGSVIDVAAPGVCILSTKNGGGIELNLGTSMAAPHVAGAAAVIASGYGAPLTAEDVAAIEIELLYSDYGTDYVDISPDGIKEPLLRNTLAAATISGTSGPDLTPPTPVISSTSGDTTSQTSVPFTIDFGEPINGFVDEDIQVANGVISSFTGSDGDSVYDLTVNFSPVANGTIMTVDISSGAAEDLAQNQSLAAAQFSITYQEPVSGSINLYASGYKLRGTKYADLTWDGALGIEVDIYRDGSLITTEPNNGAYSDPIGGKGGGTYLYEACEAGTSTCSNSVAVVF
ncbi:subtilase family protein [Yoonia sediminilitoris]|uniref:Subtilase family protein n=2 Tax=Yoonia sediminilitoris TaxID=1286148 RepID=A0A2T6K5N0_9RHOB|nr:subtilase family protein [Yoonia sediminilitoris]RCW89642.1 subtilase family protein [Yoonia sediminilitoris]